MLQSKPAKVFIYVFSAIFCIVTLYPYFVMLTNSFKSLNEIFAIPPTVLPTTWHWEKSSSRLTFLTPNSAAVTSGRKGSNTSTSMQ